MKASPRLLTFSALIFFFAGNILVLRSAFSKSSSVSSSGGSVASSSSASTSASDQEHLLLAESAIRQLRSELATTNALLGRPAVAWEDPSYPGSSGGSSRSLSQRVQRVEEELSSQNAALTQRLGSLQKDLANFDVRVRDLTTASSSAESGARNAMAAASARAASAAAAAAAAQSKPPPPPSPVQVTAPRQSLLRRRPDETAVSAPKPAPLSNHPPPLAAQPLTGVNFTPLGRETPLLMICYKRADYLRRSLAAVKRFHPTRGAVPVVISQDGSQARVRSVVEEFQRAMARDDPDAIVVHLRHEQSQNPGETGYHKLAQHYGWALEQIFTALSSHAPALGPAYKPERVIILEEDLEIAPDFFDYFAATAPLLDDPSENLLAVSACRYRSFSFISRLPFSLFPPLNYRSFVLMLSD